MRVLSDEERDQIVKEIHQSYKEEARQMIKLSDEECKRIASEVHQDYKRAVEEATQTGAELDRLSFERSLAKVKQTKDDKKLLNEMKPSLIRWLFNLFL